MSALSEDQRLLLLSRLAHHVTVLMRGCYPHIVHGEPPPEDYESWQWLNELMHGLTQELGARIDGRSFGRYPVDLHLESIFDRASRAGMVSELNDAYGRILAGIS